MRICALLSQDSPSPETPFHGVFDVQDPSIWAPEHQWEVHRLEKASAIRVVRQLVRKGFDAYFCLCDGTFEEDRTGIDVAVELERQGVAYTGADPHFFEPTREAMKRVCELMGVGTPRYAFARSRAEAAAAAPHLRFPLLVKHPNSYGSIGLTPKSRVTTPAELLDQVDVMVAEHGAVLLEEFVEGREFTVLVAEPGAGEHAPRGYPPLEVEFPPGSTFKTWALKWRTYREVTQRLLDDAPLAARLQEIAARAFEGMGGTGYARCDIRMDGGGRLFLLDVNPNPAMFCVREARCNGDVIVNAAPGGHPAFVNHLLDAAFRRRDRRLPRWAVHHHPEKGDSVVAARDLAAGERVVVNEDRRHTLVSRAHAERSFPAWRLDLMRRRGVPLSDGIRAVYDDTPETWCPIGHACDPSAWLDGLDVVARRPIARGDAVTLDYATFAAPDMPSFACSCGSPLCREVIRGADHLEPWVEERYGEHLGDWVKMARRRG